MKWFRKASLIINLVVMGFLLGTSISYAQILQTAPMNRIDGKPLPSWAQATLTRNGDAGYVAMTIHTKVGGEIWNIGPDEFLGINWKPKNATTNWWLVFNDPSRCTAPCDRDDVLAQRLMQTDHPAYGTIGLHWATGHIATSGTWSSAAILWEDNTENRVFGEPLWDAEAAEIHLIVRAHGPAKNLSPEELVDAQTMVNGGCPPNQCSDAQAAAFPPQAP